ncbi:hypothetical protein OAJ68_03225 [Candidatus Thioglobus sp.]|nr:hypothetical protein [Candidatus Thioglobus sp.]
MINFLFQQRTQAYIRLLLSFSSLSILVTYYMVNIQDIGPGVGRVYFLFFVINTIILWLITPISHKIFHINKAIIITLAFMLYVSLRFVLDQQSTEGLFGFTFGTTSGIFFGYFLGISLAYLYSGIIENIRKFPDLIEKFNTIVLLYLIFVTFFIIKIFVYYYSIKVGEFSVFANPSNYQRPGIFLFLIAVQNATLIVIIKLIYPQKKNRLVYLLFIISSFIMIALGQLVGSNFFFVSGIVLLLIIFWLRGIVSTSKKYFVKSEVKLLSLFRNWMGFKLLKFAYLVLILFFLLLFINNYLGIFDFQQLRIVGHEHYIPSLNVRFNIVKELFIMHFNYAPLFGDMFVHKALNTTYIHSLLRIIPSIGITGALFFGLVVFLVYRDINLCSKYTSRTSLNYQIFRLAMVTYILLGALVMAGYSWIPLWFIMGLFSISIMKRPFKSYPIPR